MKKKAKGQKKQAAAPEQGQQPAAEEKKYLSTKEIEDILEVFDEGIGNLEIVTETLMRQREDEFDAIKDPGMRRAYEKLAELADQARTAMEEVYLRLEGAYNAA